jgi:hypothetical protein
MRKLDSAKRTKDDQQRLQTQALRNIRNMKNDLSLTYISSGENNLPAEPYQPPVRKTIIFDMIIPERQSQNSFIYKNFTGR